MWLPLAAGQKCNTGCIFARLETVSKNAITYQSELLVDDRGPTGSISLLERSVAGLQSSRVSRVTCCKKRYCSYQTRLSTGCVGRLTNESQFIQLRGTAVSALYWSVTLYLHCWYGQGFAPLGACRLVFVTIPSLRPRQRSDQITFLVRIFRTTPWRQTGHSADLPALTKKIIQGVNWTFVDEPCAESQTFRMLGSVLPQLPWLGKAVVVGRTRVVGLQPFRVPLGIAA